MSRQNEVGKHCTTISSDEKMTNIRYHSTDVVSFNSEKIVLRNEGWQTVTTKTRMNQASRQFGLNFSVYQEKHEWYVTFKGETFAFEDGMILVR